MTSAQPQRITIAFSGEGAGEGELTWGQKENWATGTALGSWLPLGGVTPLPPYMTLDLAVEALRYAMSRYPSLRTRLRLDADGRPRQVAHASGELTLEVFDADDADDADPQQLAESVCERYRNTKLDFTDEWPLRIAVVVHQGRPTHMAALISHLAADAAGLAAMMAGMVSLDQGPVTGMQPLEQAAWQQSPAGQRHNAAAVRYWETVFREVAPRRFASVPEPRRPRYWHGEFDSFALLPAARRIAERTGQGTPTVLMTLFALALHEAGGVNPVVLRPIVGNRFRPGLEGVVCTVAQAGICVLDVAGVPFDEALQRVRRSVIKAYKYAYFDHDDMVAARTRIENERGVQIDTGLFINDRHEVGGPLEAVRLPQAPPAPGDADADAATDTACAPPAIFRWVQGQDAEAWEPLFVEVDDIPGAVRVSMHLDAHAISLAQAEAVVRGMEATALREGAA